MEAWTHYFTFKKGHEHRGYWVEIIATSNRKAQKEMELRYGLMWEKHFTGYCRFSLRDCHNGCLARYEVE